jgi:AraC family transcriptional regulator, positive regulator of tynA and feaB
MSAAAPPTGGNIGCCASVIDRSGGRRSIMSQVVLADARGEHPHRHLIPILPTAPRVDARCGQDFESAALSEGAIGRLRCAGPADLSLPAGLAGASIEGIHVLYVVAGEFDIVQAGHRGVARSGDILMLDGSAPARITMNGHVARDIIVLEVPAARFSSLWGTGASGALQLLRSTSASPLAGCMRLMAEHMHSASHAELAALYEACVSLLAAAESRLDAVATPGAQAAPDASLLRSILDYTNHNIADGALAPPGVALRFGISVRYLHKLFAGSGVTFGAYVAMRRLDHVRSELITASDPPPSIAALARKWGFRDISTFNRAFRKRFGCAPRRLRTRVAS